MTPQDPFVTWLNAQFLAWQASLGKKQSVTAWAKSLDMDRDVVNQWLNGRRRPNRESADALAERLGMDVYDALGLDKPPALVIELTRYMGDLDDHDIEAIRAILARASARRIGARAVASVAPSDRRRTARNR